MYLRDWVAISLHNESLYITFRCPVPDSRMKQHRSNRRTDHIQLVIPVGGAIVEAMLISA